MSKYLQKPQPVNFAVGVSLKSGINPDYAVLSNVVATRSGAGALDPTADTVQLTTTATGNAITLADGVEGQEIRIVYVAEAAGTDTAILTPANRGGYSTITFNAVGDTCKLLFTNTRWYIIGTRGVTIA